MLGEGGGIIHMKGSYVVVSAKYKNGSSVQLLDTRCLQLHCEVHSRCMFTEGKKTCPHAHLCLVNIGAEFAL